MEITFLLVVLLLLVVLALATALSWAVRTVRRIRRRWYETTPQTRYFVG